MQSSLGADWSRHFASFDRIPFAAASIGQVHSAVLSSSSLSVAVKIQFPNIARSIESDLGYVRWLLTAGKILPKGLFLDKTLQVNVVRSQPCFVVLRCFGR
jgi:aarF domain-containing kinase